MNRVAQTRLSLKDLIMPYFVVSGKNKQQPIHSLPGLYRFSSDNLVKEIKEIKTQGISKVLLFGKAEHKDAEGSESFSKDGALQQAVRMIKEKIKGITVITDVCLCGYTLSGHCGIVKGSPRQIDNDRTVKVLAKIASSHAQAGADLVAPSAMMDGQVGAIRKMFDQHGFGSRGILAYSAKYCSNFYGPFRDALDSRPQFSDRKTYQMDFRNSDQALKEIKADISQGADIVMVKPALAYLDIIRRAKDNFKFPLAAYNVSGEYAMVKQMAKAGVIKEKEMILEILTAIKRAGADLIITYHAKEAAKWIK